MFESFVILKGKRIILSSIMLSKLKGEFINFGYACDGSLISYDCISCVTDTQQDNVICI